MIDAITIAGVATYPKTPTNVLDLKKINYFYGSNGAGKSTIGRIIANEALHRDCRIHWKSGIQLQTLVYNCDFIASNFSQSSDLKGVFTLGEENNEILSQISEASREAESYKRKTETLRGTLLGEDGKSGKQGELEKLNSDFKEKCWSKFQKLDSYFPKIFDGYRKKEKLKEKILHEACTNTAQLRTVEELNIIAKTIFVESPKSEPPIQIPKSDQLLKLENNPIRTYAASTIRTAGLRSSALR